MNIRKFYLAILTILISSVAYSQKEKNLFAAPLKFPLSLSASFGEIRTDHYHSGVDIKTQGVTGKEVIAADDGYVYYILVSPTGFGKAIYLRHASGFSTVYCHFEHFTPEIDAYVKSLQYQNRSFSITITPPENRFRFKKGDIIGFSGNSGSSFGPHLHFEIRKTDGEKPVNPLLFNFGIEDNIKPVIEMLGIYKESDKTYINGNTRNLIISAAGSNGNYYLSEDNTIRISGLAGFGVSSHDSMNDSPNRFGINSIDLQIDSIPWFSYEINEFSFSETRYINAHIDYESYVRNNLSIEKAFVLPNDKLDLYRNYMNNGLFDFSDDKTHNIKITVKDGSNNISILTFKVISDSQESVNVGKTADSTFILMPYQRSNYFESGDLKVNIPQGALYDTLRFRFSKSEESGNYFSDVYSIHNIYTPLQKPMNVAIRPGKSIKGPKSKLILVLIGKDQKPIYAGGALSGEYVTADVTYFGNYAVWTDTIPPVIGSNGFTNGADLSGKSEIKFSITDNFSGIKTYYGTIDGNWALFEYDPRSDLLFYKFDNNRLTKSTKHSLILKVTDNCNNSSILTREFLW